MKWGTKSPTECSGTKTIWNCGQPLATNKASIFWNKMFATDSSHHQICIYQIASGELEDTRPPIAQLSEFRHFVDGDNDVDAAFARDEYAERLLAGATHESARLPSQRKAEAAERLRYAAFTPQTSYFGRAKNKVVQKVNIQANETSCDLLSGILENQSIAFSSSKKLVLTNDRKFTKQDDTQIDYDLIPEKSIMSEPLPSQRKTVENADAVTEKEKSGSDHSGAKKDDKKSDESPHNSSSTSHCHSSNDKDDHRNGHHSADRYERKRNENGSYHQHSGYSSHSRHSSWRKNNSYETTRSYRDNERGHPSSRWDRHKDGRNDSSRYDRHRHDHSRDRSSHNRSRSPMKDRKEERGSSSSHDRHQGKKSSSSHLYKSHSRTRKESSHSSSRSQWSFGYFNCHDNVISRNNANSAFVHSSTDQRKSNDAKSSENGNFVSPLASSSSDVTCQKNILDDGKADSEKKSIHHPENTPCNAMPVDKVVNSQNEEKLSDTLMDSDVNSSECSSINKKNFGLGESSGNNSRPSQNEIADVKLNISKEDIHMNISNQALTKSSAGGISSSKVSSDVLNNSPKLSSCKKAKLSSLFGDTDTEKNNALKTLENFSGEVKGKEKTSFDINSVKFNSKSDDKVPKTKKSVMLFGNDSGSDSGTEIEAPEYRPSNITPKDTNIYEEYTPSLPSDIRHTALRSQIEEYDPAIQSKKDFDSRHLLQSKTLLEGEKKVKPHREREIEKNGDSSSKHHHLHGLTSSDIKAKHQSKDKASQKEKGESCENQGFAKELTSHRKHRDKEDEAIHAEKYRRLETDLHGKGKSSSRESAHKEKLVTKDQHKSSHEKFHAKVKEIMKEMEENKRKREDAEVMKEKEENKRKMGDAEHLEKISGRRKSLEKLHPTDELKCDSRHKNRESASKLHEGHHKENRQVQDNENLEKEFKSPHKHHSGEKDLKGSEKCFTKKRGEAVKEHNDKVEELFGFNRSDTRDKSKHASNKKEKNIVEVDAIRNNSKNNGVGKKSSRNKILCEDKHEDLKHSFTSKVSEEAKKTKNSKASSDENKCHVEGNSSQRKIGRKSSCFTDLFGDIDDIESSSSNLPETLFENGLCSSQLKDLSSKEGPVTFRDKVQKIEANLEEKKENSYCTSQLFQNEGLDIQTGVNTTLEFESVSRHEESSAVHHINDHHMKQQKMSLEAKVVKVVKKFLDPYYKNKTITRDDYKQIVAKCVKKVVKAESGDDIEPDKLHSLALGYIKVFRHRQMKSMT